MCAWRDETRLGAQAGWAAARARACVRGGGIMGGVGGFEAGRRFTRVDRLLHRLEVLSLHGEPRRAELVVHREGGPRYAWAVATAHAPQLVDEDHLRAAGVGPVEALGPEAGGLVASQQLGRRELADGVPVQRQANRPPLVWPGGAVAARSAVRDQAAHGRSSRYASAPPGASASSFARSASRRAWRAASASHMRSGAWRGALHASASRSIACSWRALYARAIATAEIGRSPQCEMQISFR